MKTIRYEHHNMQVAVNPEYKGKHKEICVCHSCLRLKPNTPANCPYAARAFELSKEIGIALVMECTWHKPIRQPVWGSELRTVEAWLDNQWQVVDFRDLIIGTKFRMFEPDGFAVIGHDNSVVFEAVGDAFMNENRVWTIMTK